MVKHIKKNYAKDGKLTDREKSIAYATAWKHHNEEKLPIISPGLEMPDMAIVKNRVKKKIDKKWEELKDTHRLHQEEIKYHSIKILKSTI